MSHPVGQPFKDNGEGRCWHCGRTASEHPGITQAEIARQDIRERHDFAALHARGRTSTFYYETKSRERLADGLEAFEPLSQADAAHRRRMVRRQLKVLGLVPLNSDDFNSMSQQVRGAGVEPWLACIHRHEKTGAPCMLRVHDGGDHYYASPSREELLRVKVETVGPFPAAPAFNSPEAVAEAVKTLRSFAPVDDEALYREAEERARTTGYPNLGF